MSIFSNAQNKDKQQQKTTFFAGTQGGGFFGATAAHQSKSNSTTAEKAPSKTMAESFEFEEGAIVKEGEGDDLYIHWPKLGDSGVTLGYGYDLGKKKKGEVEADLMQAGLPPEQIQKLLPAVGLTQQAAGNFVAKNRTAIGPITNEQRDLLFRPVYEDKKAHSKSRATGSSVNNYTAAHYAKLEGREETDWQLSDEEYEALHPAIKELLADMTYQGAYKYREDWGGSYRDIQPILKAEVSDIEKLEQLKAHLERFASVAPEEGMVTRTNIRINFLADAIQQAKAYELNKDEEQVQEETEKESKKDKKKQKKDFRRQEPVTRAGFVYLLLKKKYSVVAHAFLFNKSAEEIMQYGSAFTNGERPLDPITRVEAATMLNRFAEIEGTDYKGEVYYFSDLYQNELDSWMFDAAHLSRMYGIFQGTLENEFLPFQTVDLKTSNTLIKRAKKLKQASKADQKARLSIAPLEEPAKKGEDIYESQRDNNPYGSSGTKGDWMCNVTSVAMQLHTLASKDEVKRQAIDIYYNVGGEQPLELLQSEQIEDILIRIVRHKGWSEYIYTNLEKLAALFKVTSNNASYSFDGRDGAIEQFNGNVPHIIKDGNLYNAIKKGKSVIMSNTLYGSDGHYVHLVSVESDGVIINDPFGFRINRYNPYYFLNGSTVSTDKMNWLKKNWSTFEERSKHNPELKAEMEAFLESPQGTFSQELGKLNFYNWGEVSSWNLGRHGTVMGK